MEGPKLALFLASWCLIVQAVTGQLFSEHSPSHFLGRGHFKHEEAVLHADGKLSHMKAEVKFRSHVVILDKTNMISVECHSDSLLVWPWDKNETRKWDSETVLVVTKDFECPEEWMHKRVVSVVEDHSIEFSLKDRPIYVETFQEKANETHEHLKIKFRQYNQRDVMHTVHRHLARRIAAQETFNLFSFNYKNGKPINRLIELETRSDQFSLFASPDDPVILNSIHEVLDEPVLEEEEEEEEEPILYGQPYADYYSYAGEDGEEEDEDPITYEGQNEDLERIVSNILDGRPYRALCADCYVNVDATFAFGLEADRTGIRSFYVWGQLTGTANLDLLAAWDSSWSDRITRNIWSRSQPPNLPPVTLGVAWAGAAIKMSLDLSVDAFVEASVTGRIFATAGFDASLTLKGGVEYKYGRWSEIAENSLTPKVHGPYLKAEGQARLALGFDVNLHCDIGAIASGIEILEVDTVTTVTPKVVTTGTLGENIAGCGAAESIEVVVEAMLDLSATVDSVTLQLKFNVGPFDVTAVEFDLSEPLGLPATVFETTLWDHEFYRKCFSLSLFSSGTYEWRSGYWGPCVNEVERRPIYCVYREASGFEHPLIPATYDLFCSGEAPISERSCSKEVLTVRRLKADICAEMDTCSECFKFQHCAWCWSSRKCFWNDEIMNTADVLSCPEDDLMTDNCASREPGIANVRALTEVFQNAIVIEWDGGLQQERGGRVVIRFSYTGPENVDGWFQDWYYAPRIPEDGIPNTNRFVWDLTNSVLPYSSVYFAVMQVSNNDNFGISTVASRVTTINNVGRPYPVYTSWLGCKRFKMRRCEDHQAYRNVICVGMDGRPTSIDDCLPEETASSRECINDLLRQRCNPPNNPLRLKSPITTLIDGCLSSVLTVEWTGGQYNGSLDVQVRSYLPGRAANESISRITNVGFFDVVLPNDSCDSGYRIIEVSIYSQSKEKALDTGNWITTDEILLLGATDLTLRVSYSPEAVRDAVQLLVTIEGDRRIENIPVSPPTEGLVSTVFMTGVASPGIITGFQIRPMGQDFYGDVVAAELSYSTTVAGKTTRLERISRGISGRQIVTDRITPLLDCGRRQTCRDCSLMAGCGWCARTSRCFAGSEFGLYDVFFDATECSPQDWVYDSSACEPYRCNVPILLAVGNDQTGQDTSIEGVIPPNIGCGPPIRSKGLWYMISTIGYSDGSLPFQISLSSLSDDVVLTLYEDAAFEVNYLSSETVENPCSNLRCRESRVSSNKRDLTFGWRALANQRFLAFVRAAEPDATAQYSILVELLANDDCGRSHQLTQGGARSSYTIGIPPTPTPVVRYFHIFPVSPVVKIDVDRSATTVGSFFGRVYSIEQYGPEYDRYCEGLVDGESSSTHRLIGTFNLLSGIVFGANTGNGYIIIVESTAGIIRLQTLPAAFDNAEEAAVLLFNSPISVDTRKSSFREPPQSFGDASCGSRSPVRGVWFKVDIGGIANDGNGDLYVSTCGKDTDLHATVRAYDEWGRCITDGTQYVRCGTGTGSITRVFSLHGVEEDECFPEGDFLYLLVGGRSGSSGKATIEVSRTLNIGCAVADEMGKPTANNMYSLHVNGNVVTLPILPSCLSYEENLQGAFGAWHSFSGDGSALALDTCSSLTQFDTTISVVTGACGPGLRCLLQNNDQLFHSNSDIGGWCGAGDAELRDYAAVGGISRLSIPTTEDQRYFVLISGGTLGLSKYALRVHRNNWSWFGGNDPGLCLATPLLLRPEISLGKVIISGNHFALVTSITDTCNNGQWPQVPSYHAAWFLIDPQASTMRLTLSTCDATNDFPAYVNAYATPFASHYDLCKGDADNILTNRLTCLSTEPNILSSGGGCSEVSFTVTPLNTDVILIGVVHQESSATALESVTLHWDISVGETCEKVLTLPGKGMLSRDDIDTHLARFYVGIPDAEFEFPGGGRGQWMTVPAGSNAAVVAQGFILEDGLPIKSVPVALYMYDVTDGCGQEGVFAPPARLFEGDNFRATFGCVEVPDNTYFLVDRLLMTDPATVQPSDAPMRFTLSVQQCGNNLPYPTLLHTYDVPSYAKRVGYDNASDVPWMAGRTFCNDDTPVRGHWYLVVGLQAPQEILLDGGSGLQMHLYTNRGECVTSTDANTNWLTWNAEAASGGDSNVFYLLIHGSDPNLVSDPNNAYNSVRMGYVMAGEDVTNPYTCAIDRDHQFRRFFNCTYSSGLELSTWVSDCLVDAIECLAFGEYDLPSCAARYCLFQPPEYCVEVSAVEPWTYWTSTWRTSCRQESLDQITPTIAGVEQPSRYVCRWTKQQGGVPSCDGRGLIEDSYCDFDTWAGCGNPHPKFYSGTEPIVFVDSDSDGTANWEDGCPDNEALTAWTPAFCGCLESQAFPDADSDGIFACEEVCDLNPLKESPGVCGCNQPDIDSDNDGVADCNDVCPENHLKTVSEGVCGCQAPDQDLNSDGLIDCEETRSVLVVVGQQLQNDNCYSTGGGSKKRRLSQNSLSHISRLEYMHMNAVTHPSVPVVQTQTGRLKRHTRRNSDHEDAFSKTEIPYVVCSIEGCSLTIYASGFSAYTTEMEYRAPAGWEVRIVSEPAVGTWRFAKSKTGKTIAYISLSSPTGRLPKDVKISVWLRPSLPEGADFVPDKESHFFTWDGDVASEIEVDIDYCPHDENKAFPGLCGCGREETPNCGLP